ncbi:DNA repair protein RecO [Acinetobacter sp. MD2(2019)]|uniref:DNA repair protein RecO n=1 Tax=Acinetobacter sp. MD2(2019) TaxID=2605273 RepID=UPI002D1E8C25|nr:DNA repair protein RecO C-terminal domain-containing protein [Acinetobacter sp. MD2(2019)]MEB3754402.1 DNA repair protein RecO C-terminal domain-containing protein [Acinetobacter sp. MD2(2019)]
MRNELLQGYLIHHRKYREKSHIVHLFTQEHGRVDGILRQTPPPQFQPIQIQASGKSELKNFSKLEIQQQPIFFHGDAFFCGFYLNEIILRLCPLEESLPQTFQQYAICLAQLQHLSNQSNPSQFLKQILRQFEHALLQDLGYPIDFAVDAHQNPILSERHYQFHMNEGFLPEIKMTTATLSGELILSMQNELQDGEFNSKQLQCLTKLYRQMITSLLGERPLKSRQLWVQHRHIQG